jgi:hypothetical protein
VSHTFKPEDAAAWNAKIETSGDETNLKRVITLFAGDPAHKDKKHQENKHMFGYDIYKIARNRFIDSVSFEVLGSANYDDLICQEVYNQPEGGFLGDDQVLEGIWTIHYRRPKKASESSANPA